MAKVGVWTRPTVVSWNPPGLGIKSRHAAGAVDADQPVGLRTANGGVGQRVHVFVRAQSGKRLANRSRGHGLQPEALDRLLGLRDLDDVAENQFAFASGVAGIDQAVNFLAFEEAEEKFEAVLGFFDGLESKRCWNDRQMGESPFAAL